MRPAVRPSVAAAAALLGLALAVAGCGSEPPGARASGPVELAVTDPDGGTITPATDVTPAADGSLVVTLDDLDVSAVVRVADGEVASRAVLPGSVLDVVPRPDGSVAVVATEDHGPGIRVAVVPPGGDPDDVMQLDVRPTTPPLTLGHWADAGSAVLAPDGRTVVALLDNGAGPLLVAIDPDTGEVVSSRFLHEWFGADPLGLLATGDGAGLAVVLGTGPLGGEESSATVLRLPAVLPDDLPARPAAPTSVPGAVAAGSAALGPDGEVVLVVGTEPAGAQDPTVSLVAVPAGGAAPRTLAVLPSGWDAFPNGYWEDVLVAADGTRAWVSGEAGEDSDIEEPVLLEVDLTDGTLGEVQYLSDAGGTGPMAVVDDTLMVSGYTAVRTQLAPHSVVWQLPL